MEPAPDGMLSPNPHYYEIMVRAAEIARALGFNFEEDGRTWVHVFGPGGDFDSAVTHEVLSTALGRLGRPGLGG